MNLSLLGIASSKGAIPLECPHELAMVVQFVRGNSATDGTDGADLKQKR